MDVLQASDKILPNYPGTFSIKVAFETKLKEFCRVMAILVNA